MTVEKNLSPRLWYSLVQLEGNSCSSTSLKKSKVSCTNLWDKWQFVNSVKRLVFHLTKIPFLKHFIGLCRLIVEVLNNQNESNWANWFLSYVQFCSGGHFSERAEAARQCGKMNHVKSGLPGSHTSATNGDCNTMNIIQFVSRELPVRHNIGCPTNLPAQTAIEPSGRIKIITSQTVSRQWMLCNKIYSAIIPDCKWKAFSLCFVWIGGILTIYEKQAWTAQDQMQQKDTKWSKNNCLMGSGNTYNKSPLLNNCLLLKFFFRNSALLEK